MGKNPNPWVRGRGRPSKSQGILAKMVVAHAPELAGQALFESAEGRALPIEEEGIGGKLDRISRIISRELGNAVSGGNSVLDLGKSSEGDGDGPAEAFAGLRTLLSSKSPENAFSFADSAVYANDRVIATLVRHLVDHVVIDHELRAMAVDARRRAADELRDIPAAMIDFVNRLMASGVVVDDVRNMPKSRLARVVSAIKEMGHQEALDAVPDELPLSTWSEAGDGSPTVASDDAESGLVRSSEGSADPSLAVTTVTLGGVWSDIDVSHTGYRIEERPMVSDEDHAVMRIPLPPDRSMMALAAPIGLEMGYAEAAESDRIGLAAQRFLSRYCSRTETVLTEQERRFWLFLLFEVNTPAAERQLGRNGFFDGVMMPGPSGSAVVRKLVAIDRNKLDDAFDANALAGPAMHVR